MLRRRFLPIQKESRTPSGHGVPDVRAEKAQRLKPPAVVARANMGAQGLRRNRGFRRKPFPGNGQVVDPACGIRPGLDENVGSPGRHKTAGISKGTRPSRRHAKLNRQT